MCELLGLSFNRPVTASLSFRGFRHRAERNSDGWGLARYHRGACQIIKEPFQANRSQQAESLLDNDQFTGDIFIGHVRLASRGRHSMENTHPFRRAFRSRDVVLAHNGTCFIEDDRALDFEPEGETDSEWIFCALLTEMSRQNIGFGDFRQIEETLREFDGFGTLNLLVSEGEHLYSYFDEGGYNGLYLTERVAPFERVCLRDEDWRVDLREEKDPRQRGVVVASRPLTEGEPWHRLEPGSLVVFKAGRCVYGQTAF